MPPWCARAAEGWLTRAGHVPDVPASEGPEDYASRRPPTSRCQYQASSLPVRSIASGSTPPSLSARPSPKPTPQALPPPSMRSCMHDCTHACGLAFCEDSRQASPIEPALAHKPPCSHARQPRPSPTSMDDTGRSRDDSCERLQMARTRPERRRTEGGGASKG